jgi:nitroreductase
MRLFQERRSASGFQPQPVPQKLLLDLLWAAWGVNRPDSGKRTAPSAQEMDIYVLLEDGAYLYDARGNQLTPVVTQDLRASAGAMGALRGAPVHLVYVADYDRLSRVSQSQRELYSAAHSGFIGQNVYLFCAGAGLGTRFYASVDRAGLKGSLNLRDGQAVIFGQAVGYAR